MGRRDVVERVNEVHVPDVVIRPHTPPLYVPPVYVPHRVSPYRSHVNLSPHRVDLVASSLRNPYVSNMHLNRYPYTGSYVSPYTHLGNTPLTT